MIYFIHGPDRLLAQQAASEIANGTDPGGHNTTWLDGRETTLPKLSAAIGSVTFFGTPRVIVVSELWPRSSREAESDTVGTDAAASAIPGLREALAAVPEANCLILLEPTLSAPPAALKTSGMAVNVISGAPPRGKELLEWIQERAATSGSKISPRSAQYLASRLFPQTWDRKPNNPRFDVPPDMMLIATEIDKLATAAHPGSIEEEDIRQLTPGSPDQRLFRYLDATLGRNLRSALMEWQRLESGGEEPAQLVAQMLGQIELTTLASLAGSRGPDEVARDVGNVQPGRISAVMAAAKTHGPQPVISAGDAIAADRKLKSGRLRTPVDALYDIMLSGSQQAPTHHSRHRPKRD